MGLNPNRKMELGPLHELQVEVGEWADETFGDGRDRVRGVIRHLKKECDEVEENPYDFMEWADCMMLLLDGARLVGLTPDDLLHLMREKLVVNRSREWGDVNEDGIVEHVREVDWCMCRRLRLVARDGRSTCSICGGEDAYGLSSERPEGKRKKVRRGIWGSFLRWWCG